MKRKKCLILSTVVLIFGLGLFADAVSAQSVPDSRPAGATLVAQGDAAPAATPGRSWKVLLLPMGQRVAAGVPSLVKALLLLVLFWIASIVVAALMRKLLDLNKIDDGTAADWGFKGLLREPRDQLHPITDVASRLVKWTILLFGFVAFFQTLKIDMVAKPLQNVVDTIVGAVPNLLEAFLILFIYWIAATAARLLLPKLLEVGGFDARAEKYAGIKESDEQRPSVRAGQLAFYFILILGITPFLEALGQTALVAPLTAMLEKALGFIPNIVAALILFFIGKIVANLIRELVTRVVAASGVEKGAGRLGLGKVFGARPLSEVAGTVAFFFVIVPVVVATVDALAIKAVSDPVKATLEQLLAAVPLIFVAGIVVAVGFAIAKAVRGVVESFLDGVGVDQLPSRVGLDFLTRKTGRASLAALGGMVVMGVILLFTAEQALATLHLTELSALVDRLIAFLPHLAVGLAVVLAALSLARFAGNWVGDALGDSPQARFAAPAASYAIIFLGLSMGLTQLGVGEEVVLIAVASVFGGAALALALAFGLGGRDRASKLIDAPES